MDDRKKLYRLLNNADPALDDLQPVPLTDHERTALRTHLTARPHRRWPKFLVAAVAVAALLAAGVTFTEPGRQAYATARSALDSMQYNLAEAFGVGPEFVSYTELQGLSQPLGEASVKLNGVIVNGDEITLNILAQVPGKGSANSYVQIDPEPLLVNDKAIRITGGSGASSLIDPEQNIWEETMTYELTEPLPMDRPLKISYKVTSLRYVPDADIKREVTCEGDAAFHFIASGEELAKNTRDVAENLVIPTKDGQAVTIAHLYLSPIAPRLRLNGPEEISGQMAMYSLRGHDEAGHKVSFSTRSKHPGQDDRLIYDEPIADAYGQYGSTLSGHDFTKNSQRITLTLYRQLLPKGNGREGEPEPISEPFTIDLQNR